MYGGGSNGGASKLIEIYHSLMRLPFCVWGRVKWWCCELEAEGRGVYFKILNFQIAKHLTEGKSAQEVDEVVRKDSA